MFYPHGWSINFLQESQGFKEPHSLMTVTPAFLIGSILSIFGGKLRIWCFKSLGEFFTFEFTIKEDHHLITSGPYKYVRHPSYTAMYLMTAGQLLIHLTKGSWIIEGNFLATPVKYAIVSWCLWMSFGWYYALKRSISEDEQLCKKFGEEWEVYRRAVPYALIPGIY